MSVLTPRRLYNLNAKRKYSISKNSKTSTWVGPKSFYISKQAKEKYTELNYSEPPSPQEIHYYQMKAMGALYLGQKMDIQKYLPELNEIMTQGVQTNTALQETERLTKIIDDTFGLYIDDKDKNTLRHFTEKSKITKGDELINEYNEIIIKLNNMIMQIKNSKNGFINDKDLQKNIEFFENRINLIEKNIDSLMLGSEIEVLNSKNKPENMNIHRLFRGLIGYGNQLRGR